MPTYTGIAEGQPGPVVDTTVQEPIENRHFGSSTSSPDTFSVPNDNYNKYKNLGNVTQQLTVVATNLTGSVTSVDVDLGNGTNVIEVDPGQEYRPTFTVELDIPETPTEIDAPANQENYSFDTEATWEVV